MTPELIAFLRRTRTDPAIVEFLIRNPPKPGSLQEAILNLQLRADDPAWGVCVGRGPFPKKAPPSKGRGPYSVVRVTYKPGKSTGDVRYELVGVTEAEAITYMNGLGQ